MGPVSKQDQFWDYVVDAVLCSCKSTNMEQLTCTNAQLGQVNMRAAERTGPQRGMHQLAADL